MAERVADVPDEADWPEIEEDLVPESSFLPDAGPFERPFEYLHGARATLDADVMRPTKLLAITAARSLLRVVDETDTEVEPRLRETFERIAEGEVGDEKAELVEALGQMASFVETNIDLGGNQPEG